MRPGGATFATPNLVVMIDGSFDATYAPTPMKRLCIANPVTRCCAGRLSPTNARNGSIEMLIDASMIHSIPAATQREGEFGMATSAIDARTAPVRKYGRRRPRRFQVRSEK